MQDVKGVVRIELEAPLLINSAITDPPGLERFPALPFPN